VEHQLTDLLTRVEEQYGPQPGMAGEEDEDEDDEDEDEDEPGGNGGAIGGPGYRYEGPDEVVAPPDVGRIEELFARAAKDRSKAFELKQELDRLGLFKQYEDRFLDLFKKAR
jgi:hypothetical protein